MNSDFYSRTQLLIGEKALTKIKNKHILIAGLGGVGGYAAEILARAGVGKLTIVDFDTVSASNINRQIIALNSNVGQNKLNIIETRLKDINPEIEIIKKNIFINYTNIEEILEQKFDYIIDAIDSLSPKINLISTALNNNFNLISSMGAGAKLDPTKVVVTDISKSYNDNLARILRKRLHRINIRTGFKVVFSSEKVIKTAFININENNKENKKTILGSISYMPAIFGIYIASTVINDLIV